MLSCGLILHCFSPLTTTSNAERFNKNKKERCHLIQRDLSKVDNSGLKWILRQPGQQIRSLDYKLEVKDIFHSSEQALGRNSEIKKVSCRRLHSQTSIEILKILTFFITTDASRSSVTRRGIL